jgi:hypothetical protein
LLLVNESEMAAALGEHLINLPPNLEIAQTDDELAANQAVNLQRGALFAL